VSIQQRDDLADSTFQIETDACRERESISWRARVMRERCLVHSLRLSRV
jgi:hypothetical protein